MLRQLLFVAVLLGWAAVCITSGQAAPTPGSSDGVSATQPAVTSKFTDPADGDFDVSGFLASREGFLPIVIPITEPAVGYGLGAGLAFMHSKPVARPGQPGEPDRLTMPSTTMVFGAATENGTWAGGLAHLGVWDQGRVRYLGGLGYGSINLKWYGKNDDLEGHGINYTDNSFFFLQKITFQLGNSDFYAGPQYRFMDTDSSFEFTNADLGIPQRDFESKNSGVGVTLGYDSRDNPFNPNRGFRAEITYTQNAEWLGGDFTYNRTDAYLTYNLPLTSELNLATRFETSLASGDVPYYDVPYLNMRGLPLGRFTDDATALLEMELRWQMSKRWSLLGFGGVGRVGSSYGDLFSTDNRPTLGAGFRYLVAREYGISMGMDVAYGDEAFSVYIGVGTSWPRP